MREPGDLTSRVQVRLVTVRGRNLILARAWRRTSGETFLGFVLAGAGLDDNV